MNKSDIHLIVCRLGLVAFIGVRPGAQLANKTQINFGRKKGEREKNSIEKCFIEKGFIRELLFFYYYYIIIMILLLLSLYYYIIIIT